MSKYRNGLPQMGDKIFLTDSGLETFICFQLGVDLPEFASFPLLDRDEGRQIIRDYMIRHIEIALDGKMGFVMETPTWRASADWGAKVGYDKEALRRVNIDAVQMMHDLRDAHETEDSPFVISGNIGPRGDGYNPDELLSPEDAAAYHADQIAAFADAGADLVTTLTMTHSEEAIGITRAAMDAGMPVVMSFTTETDGRLPTGQELGAAIDEVDAATGNGPAYYMVNCAHPTHFDETIEAARATDAAWLKRLRGLRANASTQSHEELDNSPELDEGNPVELGGQYKSLMDRLPQIAVVGGCCGTDHRHVQEIASALKSA